MPKKPAKPRTTRKKRGFGQERRGEILAAATELFTSEGYNRVTTRAIARKVGISQTGLYVYFKTKEDILRAIRHQVHDALTVEFDAAVAAARSPKEALSKLVRSYIDFGLSHPAEYQLTFTISSEALAPIDKDLSQPFDTQDSGARSFLRFRDHLVQLSRQGLAFGFDPITAVHILWFIGHGAVSLLISHSHFPWMDRNKLIDSLERFVMAGLAR
jgi:AcrR family transcriptional regulator